MTAGRRLLAPALVMGVLAGCGGARAPELAGRTFLSETITEDDAPRALVEGTRITLVFHDDGRLTASAGCNTLSGPVRVQAGRILVDDVSTTAIGCAPDLQDQDDWLSGFFALGPRYRLEVNRLRLETDHTSMQLVDRRTADPDRPLERTLWRLDGIVGGDAVSSIPAEVSVVLHFQEGRVTVEGSCNHGGGDAEVSGHQLRIGRLVTTDKLCGPAASDVEAAVARVLEGSVAYRVEAATLTLSNPNGSGLLLRAPA